MSTETWRRRSVENRRMRRDLSIFGGPALAALTLLVAFLAPEALALAMMMAFILAMTITWAMGALTAAFAPPLPRWSEVSLLGRHAVWFVRIALGTTAVIGTGYINWLLNHSLDDAFARGLSGGSAVEPLLLYGVVPVIYGAFLVVSLWLWLDITRLGRRGRMHAAVLIVRKLALRPGPTRRIVRAMFSGWLGAWWWTLASFFFFPALAFSAIALVVGMM